MAYIEVIEHDNSEGELKEVYDGLVKSRGKLAEVHKIQSLNPKSIIDHMNLYMTIMFGKSPLKRVQREIIAVVVSKSNNCEYCQTHHAEAVNAYWKNTEKVQALKRDYRDIELSEIDYNLCVLAENLTKTPNWDKQKDHLDLLKNIGLEDRAILDATLVISYFNFVNRMVLGLGIQLEEHKGAGFIYD